MNLGLGLSPFSVLCQMISAELWKRHHGFIRLYTDTRTALLLGELGVDQLYDEVNATVVDGMAGDINPKVFWAAPKHFALRDCELPCCSVDTDLLLFQPLRPDDGNVAQGLHHDPPPTPMNGWWIGCFNLHTTGSGGDVTGSMWSATPIPMAMRRPTARVPMPGTIVITSSAPSIRTSLGIDSSSSSWRATNWRG